MLFHAHELELAVDRASRQKSRYFILEYDCVFDGALLFFCGIPNVRKLVPVCKYPMKLAFFIRKRNSSHASDFCPSVGSTIGIWGVGLFDCPGNPIHENLDATGPVCVTHTRRAILDAFLTRRVTWTVLNQPNHMALV